MITLSLLAFENGTESGQTGIAFLFCVELIMWIILWLVHRSPDWFVIALFRVINYQVKSISMQPTLYENDRVKINRCDDLKRFDVVAIRPPAQCQSKSLYIKRVIALEGETIEIRDGATYINGTLQEEPFDYYPSSYNLGPMRVPPGKVFVLGDNRDRSEDCYEWVLLWGDEGFIPIENVLGHSGK